MIKSEKKVPPTSSGGRKKKKSSLASEQSKAESLTPEQEGSKVAYNPKAFPLAITPIEQLSDYDKDIRERIVHLSYEEELKELALQRIPRWRRDEHASVLERYREYCQQRYDQDVARLFVAIEIPDRVKEILAPMQNHTFSGVTWLPKSMQCLCVLFLGEVERSRVPEVCAALREVHSPSFVLSARSVAFKMRSRIGKIGVSFYFCPEIFALHAQVEAVGKKFKEIKDFPFYSPMMEMGRIVGGKIEELGAFAKKNLNHLAGSFVVDKFCLFESVIGEQWAEYIPIESFPLEAAGTMDWHDMELTDWTSRHKRKLAIERKALEEQKAEQLAEVKKRRSEERKLASADKALAKAERIREDAELRKASMPAGAGRPAPTSGVRVISRPGDTPQKPSSSGMVRVISRPQSQKFSVRSLITRLVYTPENSQKPVRKKKPVVLPEEPTPVVVEPVKPFEERVFVVEYRHPQLDVETPYLQAILKAEEEEKARLAEQKAKKVAAWKAKKQAERQASDQEEIIGQEVPKQIKAQEEVSRQKARIISVADEPAKPVLEVEPEEEERTLVRHIVRRRTTAEESAMPRRRVIVADSPTPPVSPVVQEEKPAEVKVRRRRVIADIPSEKKSEEAPSVITRRKKATAEEKPIVRRKRTTE